MEEKISLDSIFESFGPMTEKKVSEQTKPVTFWIPVKYRTKYDHLQDRTNKQFSKLLIEVLKTTIEKAEQKI